MKYTLKTEYRVKTKIMFCPDCGIKTKAARISPKSHLCTICGRLLSDHARKVEAEVAHQRRRGRPEALTKENKEEARRLKTYLSNRSIGLRFGVTAATIGKL